MTDFGTGAGLDRDAICLLVVLPKRDPVGSNAAGAVAGNFGGAAVGVDEVDFEIGGCGGREPLDAVGADAVVAVADLAGEDGFVTIDFLRVDQQEVVAAGGGLHEWDRLPSRVVIHTNSFVFGGAAVVDALDDLGLS